MKKYYIFFNVVLFSISINAQNLLTSDIWKTGNGSVIDVFYQNGSSEENERIISETPYGTLNVVWEATPDDESDADGGWRSKDIPITDNTQTYRLCVWIKKSNSNISGVTYFGCNNGSSATLQYLNGSDQKNPYFWYGDLPSVDEWYLLVGFIRGYNTTLQTNLGGIYNTSGQKVALTVQDFKFKVNTFFINHRTYLYYDTNVSDRQYFYAPRVEVVDGSEPSIQDMLDNDLSYNKILREVGYSYDNCGNRTNRFMGSIIVSKSAKNSGDEIGSDETPPVIETILTETLSVKIHPNPTEGLMKIEISGLSQLDNTDYTLYDFNGKLLKHERITTNRQDIDIQHFADGIYVLAVNINGEVFQWKIIKQ